MICTVCLSTRFTRTPMLCIACRRMFVSRTSGIFSIRTVSSVITEAASIASAAFFAPPISTSPTSGFPPQTTYCSIFILIRDATNIPLSKHRHSALLSREHIADAAPKRYPRRPFHRPDSFLKNYYKPLIFLYAKLCLVKSDIEYLKYYTMYTKIMPAINPNAIISHFSGL